MKGNSLGSGLDSATVCTAPSKHMSGASIQNATTNMAVTLIYDPESQCGVWGWFWMLTVQFYMSHTCTVRAFQITNKPKLGKAYPSLGRTHHLDTIKNTPVLFRSVLMFLSVLKPFHTVQ